MKKVNDVLYWYRVEVLSVYDGDTARGAIDQGFGITGRGEAGKGIKLRFFGINTAEMRGGTEETKAKAREAKAFVADRILGKKVVLHTVRDETGKYGRYLAVIHEIIPGEDGDEVDPVSINDKLIAAGLADSYMV